MQKIAKGDEASIKACIQTYGPLLMSMALRLFHNPSDAEDAVQEAFISIWENAHRYRPSIASESTFVSMLGRRRFFDRIRKQNRSIDIDQEHDFDQYSPEQQNQKTFQDQESAHDATLIMDAIRHQKPPKPKILKLFLVDRFSQREISDALNLPLGTVKSHIQRGILSVKDHLHIAVPNEAASIQGAVR